MLFVFGSQITSAPNASEIKRIGTNVLPFMIWGGTSKVKDLSLTIAVFDPTLSSIIIIFLNLIIVIFFLVWLPARSVAVIRNSFLPIFSFNKYSEKPCLSILTLTPFTSTKTPGSDLSLISKDSLTVSK